MPNPPLNLTPDPSSPLCNFVWIGLAGTITVIARVGDRDDHRIYETSFTESDWRLGGWPFFWACCETALRILEDPAVFDYINEKRGEQ